MRAVTILICVVVMVAVVCAQQQQQHQRTGKQDKNVAHKHHQNVESAASHGKQDIKATKNGKSKSNIKAEWKTETLVVEVSPSQKSHKKASTKAEVPIIEKHAPGKNTARLSVGKVHTKKQNKVDAKNVVMTSQEEEIVEEEEEVVVPKKQQKKVVAKPVKYTKTSVTETKKEKPCPCSAGKMEEVIEEDIETIDEVFETPCAAAKTIKKSKTQSCRKVVEEEDSTEETPCSKKAKKNNCATMSKKGKKSTKSVTVSTKPIKQCPLGEMVQCAKGWEHDLATGECKPSTGCSIKKEKALKKIGIRLPATHSVTVKQDESDSADFTVDIVSNDKKDGETQQFIVTDSDDTEIVNVDEDDVCEMCTQY